MTIGIGLGKRAIGTIVVPEILSEILEALTVSIRLSVLALIRLLWTLLIWTSRWLWSLCPLILVSEGHSVLTSRGILLRLLIRALLLVRTNTILHIVIARLNVVALLLRTTTVLTRECITSEIAACIAMSNGAVIICIGWHWIWK